ncbi:MAG: glycosyltransferase [Chloroflexi bacterium]|nr:glycosyltransferase [Chloroflexota bacterium]
MKVSVIVTVRNEERSIDQLLDTLTRQTRRPDEVVIVDGGSTDSTLDIIRSYEDRLPLRVIVRQGCNISAGRNAAIRAASSDVIASTDAGVRLAPKWLESLVRPLENGNVQDVLGDRKSDPAVVSGFFEPDPQTAFEVAMGATVLPRLREINPTTFLPSSRSIAFFKRAWEEVGGYPEWLDYCEDLVFDLALRRKGYHFAFAPEALVHFRPRSSLRAFLTQYYRYARGDGKADLWLKRHLIRYSCYMLGLALLLVGFRRKPAWAPLALAGVAYLYQPYRRLLPQLPSLSPGEGALAVGWVPIIRVVGDIAKMVGYPVGVLWRLTRGQGLRLRG